MNRRQRLTRTRIPKQRFSNNQGARTFTPNMAARTGNLFAAAPIIQGHWDGSGTPDVVSFGRGSQVHDNWYENFDPYQGTVVITAWTPEKDRDATQTNDEYLFHLGASAGFIRYEHDDQRLFSWCGNRWMTVAHTTAAGTAVALAQRWDSQNPFDGTNSICISINDAHTFDADVPDGSAPDPVLYVGSSAGTAYPANAIEEAPMYCRLPLWDGSYGVDINGSGVDIIQELYNAGSYEDLAKLVPAWHICSCLCTDATTGELEQTGQMWGWDFLANVLGAGDGYCSDTYGGSNWVTELTPSAGPADIASTVDQIFGLQGYQWTLDAANEGIKIALTGLDAGENFLLVVDAHEEGVTTTGANLLLNPGFENYAGVPDDGNSDDFTTWAENNVNDPAGNKIEATIIVGNFHTGLAAVMLTRTTSAPLIAQTFAAQPGATYQLSFWTRGDGAQAGRYRVRDLSNSADIIVPTSTGVAGVVYTQVIVYFVAPRACTSIQVQFIASLGAGVCYFDTSSVYLTADDIRIRIVDDTNGGQLTNFPDWEFGAGSGFVQMGEGVVTFELPTIARHGVGADCTAITIKVVGTIAGQTVYCHQCLLYVNESGAAIDNPSFEGTWAGGPPAMPPGWTNQGLDPGDIQTSSTGGAIIHSGAEAAQFNVGATAGEGIRMAAPWSTVGDFFCFGAFSYGDGTAGFQLRSQSVNATAPHNSAAGAGVATPVTAAWTHTSAVWRVLVVANSDPRINASGAPAGNRYLDDVYCVPLRAIPLTVTAASEANSAEVGGLRVDGYDTAVSALKPQLARNSRLRGQLEVGVTPRHAIALAQGFGQTREFSFRLYEDANNVIGVRRRTNLVDIFQNYQGVGVVVSSWTATGLWNADTKMVATARWGRGYIALLVDGIERAVITGDRPLAADFTADVDWMTAGAITQADAVATEG